MSNKIISKSNINSTGALIFELINWYSVNKRLLPWRQTIDPYTIWLSEIILQQTKIVQGIPYFNKFKEEFPTIFHLANASEEKIMKCWQGLGYYSRARNLHVAAKQVVECYNGFFPSSFSELLKLKGVGNYTAAAIASIAYGEKVPVLDGNVYRVISRLYAIDVEIQTPKAFKIFNEILQGIIPSDNPGDFNQALMELGALVCLPENPKCLHCPIALWCTAKNDGTQKFYPVKKQKPRPRERYFNYLLAHGSVGVFFTKRTSKDIWQNLYEYPMVETEANTNVKAIKKLFESLVEFPQQNEILLSREYLHKLTHQTIVAKFWKFTNNPICKSKKSDIFEINPENSDALPIHRLMDKYIKNQ